MIDQILVTVAPPAPIIVEFPAQQGLAGPPGEPGANGEQGIPGDKGDPGTDGVIGRDGVRGSLWYRGAAAPGAVAGQLAGDLYLDTSTSDVYELGEDGQTWAVVVNIKGIPGVDGAQGPPGISAYAIVNVASDYTLGAADGESTIRVNSAAGAVVIVPDNATPIPVGSIVPVRQLGVGQITIGNAAGVIFNVPVGKLQVSGFRGATVQLAKVAADEWDLYGDLAAGTIPPAGPYDLHVPFVAANSGYNLEVPS